MKKLAWFLPTEISANPHDEHPRKYPFVLCQ
jgi:hypothetical protein